MLLNPTSIRNWTLTFSFRMNTGSFWLNRWNTLTRQTPSRKTGCRRRCHQISSIPGSFLAWQTVPSSLSMPCDPYGSPTARSLLAAFEAPPRCRPCRPQIILIISPIVKNFIFFCEQEQLKKHPTLDKKPYCAYGTLNLVPSERWWCARGKGLCCGKPGLLGEYAPNLASAESSSIFDKPG